MLDINWIKANPEAFAAAIGGRKNVPFSAAELIGMDDAPPCRDPLGRGRTGGA